MKFRIGFGFDTHKLEKGYELWLGGILIPHTKGAVGHSDADTLIHAICDALLGAATLGDIGTHFPDTNPEFKGIESTLLLKETVALVKEKGYSVNNIDSTIVLQSPKLSSHMPAIRSRLAETMGINVDDISIKAKTSERLGFIGREEGVSAYAIAMLTSS